MKYCVDYYSKSQILEQVDEINIDFFQLEGLLLHSWLEKHNKQRINFCIDVYDEEKIINALEIQKEKKEQEIYIRLPEPSEWLGATLINYPEAKFYFNDRVNDWDRLLGYIDYGVSDIFIVEGLGFELDKVAAIVHLKNIQIRVFPNVAQSQWKEMDAIKKFFIRPEDVGAYNSLVDVFEIFGEKERQEIIYKIYKVDKTWMGPLKEIIIGFNDDMDNRFVIPRFAKKRTRCNRDCLKGGLCRTCDQVRDLSKSLDKAGIIVTEDKEKK